MANIIMSNAAIPQPVLVICGPTASGKSGLAIRLAKKLGGEVISADSRQVYRGLNIGTGKVTKKEMSGIKHHLLDVADPKKRYTVVEFREQALEAMNEIAARGHLPIICGGTGFYIDALFGGYSIPAIPENKKLRQILQNKTAPELLVLLAKLDPARARAIAANRADRHNPRRLIRAIEIVEGQATNVGARPVPTSTFRTGRITKANPSLQRQYTIVWLGLNPGREKLRKMIRRRLLERLDAGMIEEVQNLHKRGLSWARMEELGLEYRFVSRYLRKMISYQEMVDQLDTAIGQYAKRQMTWFRRNKKIRWSTSSPLAFSKKAWYAFSRNKPE